MGDSFERIGYNKLNHKLKITGGGLEVSSGNIRGSISSTGSFGYISIGGTALPETIADTVGAMVGSNTETGIGVTYQDGDNTLDFALDAAQTTITSLLATDIKIGEDDQTKIDFGTTNEIRFAADNQVQFKLIDGGIIPLSDSDVDLGTTSARFKDAYVDSITVTGNIRSAGDIIAENYIVSSSVTYMTQSFSSGSTVFGDNSGDLHKFTGSLLVTGSVKVASGNAEFAGNVSGSVTSTGSFGAGYIDNKLGIGTKTPDYTLDVAGNVGFNEYIYHNGDADTYIRYQSDQIDFVAGAANMIYMNEGGGGDQADKVAINNDLADVDFQVKGDNDANLFRTDALNDTVGIGTASAANKLEVHGDFYATGSISGSSTSTGSFGRLELSASLSASATSTGSFGAVYVGGMSVSNVKEVSSSIASRAATLEGSGTIQGVGTTNAVTFATVDTGQGANELYDMDQNVKTDSNVTFANVTATGIVTAEEFHTEFVSASIVYASGSTKLEFVIPPTSTAPNDPVEVAEALKLALSVNLPNEPVDIEEPLIIFKLPDNAPLQEPLIEVAVSVVNAAGSIVLLSGVIILESPIILP